MSRTPGAESSSMPGGKFTSQSMGSSEPHEEISRPWLKKLFPPALIVLAGLLVYAGSFQGEFILDDKPSIVSNPSIRRLWPLKEVLFPPPGSIKESSTVEGRPLLNFSFALNHAVGGVDVRGYHVVNLAIHLAAGLLLYGIVRRTLLLPKWSASGLCAVAEQRVDEVDGAGTERSDRTRACADHHAIGLALASTLIWVVHPLQTESVSYVVQRAESLAGMFYLLTMYLSIRGFASGRAGWSAGAVVACVLGTATKEVLVTAPLMVMLYDRTFVAGSFGAAWRARRIFYLFLFLCGWGTLAGVMVGTGGSNLGNVKAMWAQLGGDAAPAESGHDVHWLDYARMQGWAVARYLGLSIWPGKLVFYYGKDVAQTFWAAVLPMLLVVTLLVVTVMACWRRPALGFLGAWFFLILAPTSSVIPLSGQIVAEHRMYLPLAAVVLAAVLGGHACMGWKLAWPAAALVLVMLGGLTIARNRDYRTALGMWEDTVSKWPGNAPAQNFLANALLDNGRTDEAIVHFEKTLQLEPRYAGTHNNLGNALLQKGRLEEAAAHYEEALKIRPGFTVARNNLGAVYFRQGRVDEAAEQFERVLLEMPNHSDAHNNLSLVWEAKGRMDEAIASCKRALEIRPENGAAECNLGNFYYRTNRLDEAAAHYRRALELSPSDVTARKNLGSVCLQQKRVPEAIGHYEKALEIDARDAEAHNNLGVAFYQSGRVPEAISQYRKALELRPDYADARGNLAMDLMAMGETKEAVVHLRKLVESQPQSISHLASLAWALATCADDAVRNGFESLQFADRALQLSGGNDPAVLRIVAAARAETGRYEEAVAAASQALQAAVERRDDALAEHLRRELDSYRDREPVREGKVGLPAK